MTNSYFDHTWFGFRPQDAQPRLDFGASAKVAIHFVIHLEAFHLNPGKPAPSGLTRPYPDVTNWTQRKVGVRDGLARVCELLEEADIAASFVIEADTLDVIAGHKGALNDSRHSIIGGGQHAALLQSEFQTLDEEANYIRAVRSQIESHFDNAIAAWCSPAGAHSPWTLDALAKAGVRYVLDFNNDDAPYGVHTRQGELICLPYQHFASDLHCLHTAKQPTSEYLADLSNGIDWLLMEARKRGPRLLTIPLHPWLIGAPHRFTQFRESVLQWKARPGVVFAGAREVVKSISTAQVGMIA